jgi:hypothetical protein
MVTAVRIYPMCGVQQIAIKWNRQWFRLGLSFRISEDYDF